jgi:hypothetical protein
VPTPVWNPQINDYSYFQNFSFDYLGVHFMGIDWAIRVIGGLTAETAVLHDFPGGTWPWFTEYITNCSKTAQENIVMASHHPMHPMPLYAFSPADDTTIETFTQGCGSNVYADFAGHYHINFSETKSLGQYDIYISAATWENAVRVVSVRTDGTAFTYWHQVINVP